MRKVMLVDDEYMLLRGLKKLADWAAYGFEVVETEQNPVAALEYLAENQVDLLFSDMNMPEMAGPEFVVAAKRLQPNLALVVASGYDDFDYVKAGLQANAVNYLRKPIDPEELTETLAKVQRQLNEQDATAHNELLAAQTQARLLLTGQPDPQDTVLLRRLGVDFTVSLARVRLVGVLNPLPPNTLITYLRQAPNVCGFFREDQDFFILIQATDGELDQFITQLPRQVGSDFRPVLIGPAVADLPALRRSFAQMRQEITRQYFFETAAGLRVMLPEDKVAPTVTLPSYTEIKHAVADSSITELDQWLTAQFDALKGANASDVLARQFALVTLLVLSDRLPEFTEDAATLADINQAPDVTTLRNLLLAIAKQADQSEQQQFSRNVLAMRQIVHDRYAEQLTLTQVALELHLSAVYLGQLFKQETGRTFAQYLNDWRVRIAVDLLQNSEDDVTEIAQAVGYQNPSYFYKLFKKQMGMSPREYRADAE